MMFSDWQYIARRFLGNGTIFVLKPMGIYGEFQQMVELGRSKWLLIAERHSCFPKA